MLGPLVALLLLTSPAAGPVDQSNCWLLCTSPTPAPAQPSLVDQLLGQDPASLRDRMERLERQTQPSILRDLLNPAPAPALTLPSSTGSSCTISGIRIC